MNSVQDVANKVRHEVDRQRNERKRTEGTLVGLLEETCNKLNEINYDF